MLSLFRQRYLLISSDHEEIYSLDRIKTESFYNQNGLQFYNSHEDVLILILQFS
jgi:hypothetical protein